jgi:hypothetical protein
VSEMDCSERILSLPYALMFVKSTFYANESCSRDMFLICMRIVPRSYLGCDT